jgi:hypothetical protein
MIKPELSTPNESHRPEMIDHFFNPCICATDIKQVVRLAAAAAYVISSKARPSVICSVLFFLFFFQK